MGRVPRVPRARSHACRCPPNPQHRGCLCASPAVAMGTECPRGSVPCCLMPLFTPPRGQAARGRQETPLRRSGRAPQGAQPLRCRPGAVLPPRGDAEPGPHGWRLRRPPEGLQHHPGLRPCLVTQQLQGTPWPRARPAAPCRTGRHGGTAGSQDLRHGTAAGRGTPALRAARHQAPRPRAGHGQRHAGPTQLGPGGTAPCKPAGPRAMQVTGQGHASLAVSHSRAQGRVPLVTPGWPVPASGRCRDRPCMAGTPPAPGRNREPSTCPEPCPSRDRGKGLPPPP